MMKSHPLARVVRIDKMTLAALEATFRAYIDRENVCREIPILRMLTENMDVMKKRGEILKDAVDRLRIFKGEITPITEQVGGGSAPGTELDGIAVRIITDVPAERLERQLRKNNIPIIARIVRDAVCFDMRTVSDDETEIIAEAMRNIEADILGR